MPPPADLIYYPDSEPGIRRKRRGRGFSYLSPDGSTIPRGAERTRIEALAVPPAYDDVWICPKPNGHLQATGYDARTRKQYRYHPDWRDWREAKKFDDLAAFGRALPRIRARIHRDLTMQDAGERDFAIAAVLALIDRLSIRVGNADYVRANRTYGATTLTARHLHIEDGKFRLSWRAKGGQKVSRQLRDKGLARVLGALHDLPGRQLIGWLDDHGAPHAVTSGDVNAHLSALVDKSGITAKTFRTWAGSEAALAVALRPGALTIKAMAQAAADRLSNTPGIARKSYIHPRIIALADSPDEARDNLSVDLPETRGLRLAERALLRLLA